MKTVVGKSLKIRRIILGYVFTAAIATTIFTGCSMGTVGGNSPQSQAQEGPPVSSEYETVREQDYGVWSYGATRSEFDPLHANVNYRHNSVQDLKAYVEVNKALLPQVVNLGGRVDVAVTFVYPMKADWFRQWAKENKFQVDSAQIDVGGTMSISGKPDDPLPQDNINNLMGGFFSGNGDGVFGTYGDVAALSLAKLVAEPKVFLVDVTPAWVRNDLAQAGITEQLKEPVSVALPYGWMERLGLENFTSLPLPTVPLPQTTYEPHILSTIPPDEK